MKKIWFIILLLIPCIAYSGVKNYGNMYCVEYVRNYDGDTITFNVPNIHPLIGQKVNVRVFGIDTPEIRGAKCDKEKRLAKEAKYAVQEILENAKKITLKDVKRDKYFRILANVIIDGHDLSKILIERNLAVEYFGKGSKKDWCE